MCLVSGNHLTGHAKLAVCATNELNSFSSQMDNFAANLQKGVDPSKEDFDCLCISIFTEHVASDLVGDIYNFLGSNESYISSQLSQASTAFLGQHGK